LKATPPLPFRLYERDQSMSYRTQGYRFVVSGRGVKSCRDVLSPKHFDLLRATCGDIQTPPPRRSDALAGTLLPGFDMKFKSRDKQEEPLKVDRTLMRQALFRGLEDHTTFGKEIVGYETLPAGGDETESTNSADGGSGVLVRFSDNSTVRGSLLVGADGGFSRIRAQLVPDVRLLDCGMRMVLGKTPLTPAFYEALGATGEDDPRAATLLESVAFVADPVPRTSPMFFMFDPMRFCRRAEVEANDPDLGASISLDYIYLALSLRSDEPEAEGKDWQSMDSNAAADLTEDLTKSWAPSLSTLVKYQDRTQTQSLRSSIIPIPLRDWRSSPAANGVEDSGPARESPSYSPMVTLIGDAAHAQPPTGGMGATTALTDAAVLGEALAEHGMTPRALEQYEAEMRGYAGPAIEGSLKGGKIFANMKDLEEMEPMRY
jgi:2-polyprenyl-6-methoxyphenol hydroxylase-like FAD-dependent oxidoreductase